MPGCTSKRAGGPARVLGIDPGGVHIGLAEFVESPKTDQGWACERAWEETWWGGLEAVEEMLPRLDVVAMEIFRLYPDKANEQTGSEMETSQFIGAVKLLVQQHNRTLDLMGASGLAVELVMQPASIQEPMKSVLRSRKIKSTAKGSKAGGHALSAELHGWYFLTQTGLTSAWGESKRKAKR